MKCLLVDACGKHVMVLCRSGFGVSWIDRPDVVCCRRVLSPYFVLALFEIDIQVPAQDAK